MTDEQGHAVPPSAQALGRRLDDDHFPETNGRMPVCRRCGFRTTGEASDHHAPVEAQEARANRWLDGQVRARHLARIKDASHT